MMFYWFEGYFTRLAVCITVGTLKNLISFGFSLGGNCINITPDVPYATIETACSQTCLYSVRLDLCSLRVYVGYMSHAGI